MHYLKKIKFSPAEIIIFLFVFISFHSNIAEKEYSKYETGTISKLPDLLAFRIFSTHFKTSVLETEFL